MIIQNHENQKYIYWQQKIDYLMLENEKLKTDQL